jgi:hypothetical protein
MRDDYTFLVDKSEWDRGKGELNIIQVGRSEPRKTR